MKKIILTAAVGAASLALAACDGGREGNNAMANEGASAEGEGNGMATGGMEGNGMAGGNGSAGASASADWPAGTRVVEEGGVTYRVGPDGTRVRIESGDVRIVTEGGVRYRVNREGRRVRIDDRGIDIDAPSVPGVDVDIGTNRKGNLDVDVNTNGQDASRDR
jgi:hypothetical protein